jgi:hypothetical protein
MITIQYDDREKFPWLLWVGNALRKKYRSRRGAENARRKLQRFKD